MVEGEDHTVFCYQDKVQDEECSQVLDDALGEYPCGYVWVENADPVIPNNDYGIY